MKFARPLRPEIGPTDLLCINRKIHAEPAVTRQSVFVDKFCAGAVQAGQSGHMVSYQEALEYPVSNPWHIRGMKFTAGVNLCWQSGRTFYYTDNGYFGNQHAKTYFRIVKNHVHDVRPVIERPRDRLDTCEFATLPFTGGRKILIAPPSVKSLSLWNMDPDVWVTQVIAQVKLHTDRPIEVRLKRTRRERLTENTMAQALADDVHCLVTYNSVAAVEAVMLGKPAICLGPNAASAVCSQSLAHVENPLIPTALEREAWLRHLSYSQFTFAEMADGTAWRILNTL